MKEEDSVQNQYLIPANTKKSQLILGFFTKVDLIIVLVGAIWSLIMLILINNNSLIVLILVMLPAIIAAFLVMPVPHYHNVLQLLTNIVNFFTNRRKYYWKGWDKYEELDGSRK